MFKIDNMKAAFVSYNTDDREDLEKLVYKQLGSIIKESKNEIDRLSSFNKKFLTYDEVLKLYESNEEHFEFKERISSEMYDNGFISTMYKAPIGLIYSEIKSDKEAFIEMLNCIKSRDGLLISIDDLNEYDMKHYLLLLVKKSLEMCNLDSNLIEMLPYKECNETDFDKKKYRFMEDKKIDLINDEMDYVYIDSADFEDEARKNRYVDFIYSSDEQAVKKLMERKHHAISIYTHDLKKAYKLISEFRADNFLINTSIEFAKNMTPIDSDYLSSRHVVFEYPKIL